MMQLIAWLLLALVHAAPALALFRPDLLTLLYRLQSDDPLFPLLHHRGALFFGILVICVWSAFDPAVRKLGVIIVSTSMLSFLAIYVQAGSPVALKRIAMADVLGLVPLAIVAWAAFAPAR
jgi:hypothetical protein